MSDRARRVPARLLDMREAITNVRSDIGLLGKDEFLADGKTQRAVIESLSSGKPPTSSCASIPAWRHAPQMPGSNCGTPTTCGSF